VGIDISISIRDKIFYFIYKKNIFIRDKNKIVDLEEEKNLSVLENEK
jgi:hypothetical protein